MQIRLPQGGETIGVGADIIEVARIRKAHEKHGARFLRRILTPEEQDYCFGMGNPYPHLAARFAAKEAVAKALTTGIGSGFGWKSASVHKGQRGEPYVRLDGKGKRLLGELGGGGVLLTLSHTAVYALAVAVITRQQAESRP